MNFYIGQSLCGGTPFGDNTFKATTGRACSYTTILKVNGGESITLNQVVAGTTLTYCLRAIKDTNCTASSTDDKFNALAWLSESVTLPIETQYLLVSFKKGD